MRLKANIILFMLVSLLVLTASSCFQNTSNYIASSDVGLFHDSSGYSLIIIMCDNDIVERIDIGYGTLMGASPFISVYPDDSNRSTTLFQIRLTGLVPPGAASEEPEVPFQVKITIKGGGSIVALFEFLPKLGNVVFMEDRELIPRSRHTELIERSIAEFEEYAQSISDADQRRAC